MTFWNTVTMVVTCLLLILAIYTFMTARHERHQTTTAVKHFTESAKDLVWLMKPNPGFTDRLQALESSRSNHAQRLNEIEDLIDLLNRDAGADGSVCVERPDEPGEVGVSEQDKRGNRAARGESDRSWLLCVAEPDAAAAVGQRSYTCEQQFQASVDAQIDQHFREAYGLPVGS